MILEINTCLFIGLSFVGVNLSKHWIKTIIISVFAGILYFFGEKWTGSSFILLGVFLLLIPIISYIYKEQVIKITVAILSGLIFDLMFIKLMEENFFDIILTRSHVMVDRGITFSLDLFIALNNIILLLFFYRRSPQLFPMILFEKPIKGDEPSVSFRFHLYFTIFLLILLNVGPYLLYIKLDQMQDNMRIILTLWSIVMCVSVLYFLRMSITNKYERMQIFLDKQYQKDLLAFYSIIRSQRHDFNFHLTSIYGLIQNKQYESCKEYIEGMVKDAYEVNELLPLHHPALGAMLSTFKELAEKKGINIHFYIMDDLRSMPCSVYEMNKIIGNLIQNAIDEVEMNRHETSDIEVEIKSERDFILIIVTNEASLSEEQLKKMYQSGFSTKSSHEGLGLPTVKSIVTKYNGTLYSELVDESIQFTVSIPIST